MTLDDHLRSLLSQFGQGSSVNDVVVVELHSRSFDEAGIALVSSRDLVSAADYERRFEQLLSTGYGWINLSYYGLLDGRPLVMIELPWSASGATETFVNYSGPSKRVRDAGGDARAGIKFSEN